MSQQKRSGCRGRLQPCAPLSENRCMNELIVTTPHCQEIVPHHHHHHGNLTARLEQRVRSKLKSSATCSSTSIKSGCQPAHVAAAAQTKKLIAHMKMKLTDCSKAAGPSVDLLPAPMCPVVSCGSQDCHERVPRHDGLAPPTFVFFAKWHVATSIDTFIFGLELLSSDVILKC